MKYLTKKTSNLLIFSCCFVYIFAYLGRLNYSASMVKIISELGFTESHAGLVYSCFTIVYGVGQLVNGILCRHYNPKYVLPGALLVSALANFMMPFWADYRFMAATWLINGAAQSILWSLLIRTLSRYIQDKELGKAIFVMSTPAAAGTALAYGCSALFVQLDVWQGVFYVAAAGLVAAGVIFYYVMTRVENAINNGDYVLADDENASESVKTNKSGARTVSLGFYVLLGFICVTAVANGLIKDGINNWVPKILTDEFNVAASLSIVLTLTLPLCGVFGAVVSRKLYDIMKDHMLLNATLFAVSFGLVLSIYLLFPQKSVPLTMVLFMGVACMMAAINNVITSMFPLDNRKYMDSGLLAGALDTVCYVGSSLAGVLLGAVAEKSGWSNVFILLIVFSGGAALLSFAYCLAAKLKRTK